MNHPYEDAVSRERSKYARTLLTNERTAFHGLASRGFSCFPGFGHEAVFENEVTSKLAFEEANQKLIQFFSDRDLKRYGVEFDNEFKLARSAFELHKAQLMSDLNKELAELKKITAMKDAEVDSWLAEIRLRQVFLIEAQAQLTEDKEELKQQSVAVEASVEPERRVAIAKKLAVVEARLDIIPTMLELLAAQSAVVEYNSTVLVDSLNEVIAAEKEVATAKSSLIDPSLAKAQAVIDYANKLSTLNPHVISKAGATTDLAVAEKAYIDTYDTPLALAQLDFSNTQSQLLPLLLSIAASKEQVALSNSDVAAAELEKANASYQVAVANYVLYDKMDERANRLLNEVLPEQYNLVSALKQSVEYKKQTSANRVAAAGYKVSVAQSSASAFVLQTKIDTVNTKMERERLEYMLGEKQYRVKLTDAQVAASSIIYDAKAAYIDVRIESQEKIATAETDATTRSNAATLKYKTECPALVAGYQEKYYKTYSQDRGYEETQTAEIASKAKITSTVVHTIS